MSQANSVDINVIVDESSSMVSCKDATIEALNGYIVEQRKVPGDCKVTMAYFSDPARFEYVLKGESVQTCRLLDKENYRPSGCTALLDAMGRMIDDTGKRLAALPESQRPNKVLVVIITDGEENSSVAYNKRQVIDMVDHQRTKYQWEFVFLAADMDKVATEAAARDVGIYANTMSYGKASTQTAIRKLSSSTMSYRGSSQKLTSAFFDADDTPAPAPTSATLGLDVNSAAPPTSTKRTLPAVRSKPKSRRKKR